MEEIYLTLIFHAISWVHAVSHSLRYYYTGVSGPGSGLPEFSIVGYMDDQQTELYNSDIGKCVPVATWVRKERPEQWLKKTLISKANEALFKHEVKIVMKRFNHTEGFHFAQVMHSCELKDDGSIVSYEEFRYDGREYMYLDIETGLFISTMAEAQITTQRWNSPDVRAGERIRNYLANECIDRLRRYVVYGREDLERRVRPGVKVTGRKSDKVTKLHCLVYGFHPRAVDVKWMKNGIDEVPSYETTHVLPNPDGTYQIRVSVEVIPKEGERYSCYVDHSSLEEPLLVKLEPEQDSPLMIIIIVVVVVLICVIAVVVLFKKIRNSYTAANTSDTPADTSNEVDEEL
ncbi:class I histocompatibility antigen, F10 alpha chain-like [Bufo gargarizans]|uniref:class I histocompatibility antigen, F10 alpha chain-like n=1 Tax=Bufo gargarizans TaxID=30331 RepID=UPI001CF30957|nr:class I histocompatibility antigen, F10 alpha chain-like [Bufo gargarizans]